MVITSAQLRAARALVGVSQQFVADLANVSVPTIKRMERGDGPVRGSHLTVSAVVAVLEAAGVVFTNDDEPGVKLRKINFPMISGAWQISLAKFLPAGTSNNQSSLRVG